MASADLSYLSLLNDQVKCDLCLETFTSPRVLKCLHSFCESCLEKHQRQNTTQGTIICPRPLCQKNTVLRDEGISGLPKDFRAVALIEKLERATGEQLQQKKKQVTKMCEVCGDADSEGKTSYVNCSDCDQVMCQKCGDLHRKMKISQHHTLTAVSSSNTQIRKGEQSPADKVGVCVKHKGGKMDLFCSTCLIPVCQECSAQAHRNHQCNPVKKMVQAMRGEISSRLSRATQLNAEDIEAIAIIENVEQSVKNLEEEIESTFTRSTDRWKNDLRGKKGPLFLLQTELAQIRHRIESNVESLAEIQKNAKDFMVCNNEYRIASSYKELRESLDSLLCETTDRSSIDEISKKVSRLQLQVNHKTCFGSLVVTSRERRNIGVSSKGGPEAVTFTRDGRLAVFASFVGPADSMSELSYYTHRYGDVYRENKKKLWQACCYSAIKQTDTLYRTAETFGMETRLQVEKFSAFSSLSDLRFVVLHTNLLLRPTSISLLSEDLKDIPINHPLEEIFDIAIDLDDNIYVSCAEANVIYVVRPNGTVVRSIPTGVFQPKLIAVCPCSPDRIIFTHDSSMVSIIDCNGKLLRTITRPEWKEVAIGCDNKKLLYILSRNSTDTRALQRLTTEGRLLDTLFEYEEHSCYSLLLAVSPDGSAAVVTDQGKDGNVTVISTAREVESYSMH